MHYNNWPFWLVRGQESASIESSDRRIKKDEKGSIRIHSHFGFVILR